VVKVRAVRGASRLNPIERGNALLEQGRAEEALEISGALVACRAPDHAALFLHAAALKALHRHEEALRFDREATRRFPLSGVAWHNLAATLGDLGRADEALRALDTGFSVGLDSPLSLLVKGRAHIACGEVGAAETALRQALLRGPAIVPIAVELAGLVWMARGDLGEALSVFDRAFHGGAPPGPLLIEKARLLSGAGDTAGAADLLSKAVQHLACDADVLRSAAKAAVEADRLFEADRFARKALKLEPESVSSRVQMTIVHLALGRTAEAIETIRPAFIAAPGDQPVLAWTATAARAAGDSLSSELCDYDRMVGVFDLETPPRWSSRDHYLRDLADALSRHHVMKEHPAAQSLRNGTQTTYRLTGSKEPAIQAFFKAIEAPVRQYMEALGRGPDPLRRRNTGDFRIVGAWSVRLRAGGFHFDHMHHEGWLSSAFYAETPESALQRPDREGWLRLGHPPYPTRPPLPAERFVRPVPGRLVLFPSYMWHGTVPFTTEERRTTIAFDMLPA
jgi:tetratricopeptide (TPR) repeat protein